MVHYITISDDEEGDPDVGGHPPKPKFFRIMMPDFLSKLPLPNAFHHKYISEKEMKGKRSKAILLSPAGKKWIVTLNVAPESCYFSEGWQRFVQAHELQRGYLLLFCYEGHLVFSFNVFDLTTCEKHYPDPRPSYSTATAAADEDVKLRSTRSPKEMKLPTAPPINRGSYAAPNKKSSTKSFSVTIKHCNLKYNYMLVPRKFMASGGLSTEQSFLILRDQKGRSWQVSLYHYHTRKNNVWKRKGTHISSGWKSFARGNQLKLGDVCAFEMVTRRKAVMQVRVVKT